jgi:hypothetical protein
MEWTHEQVERLWRRRIVARSQEISEITPAESDTRKNERQAATMQESKLLRHGVERQLRWALIHGGDQELIDLLKDRRDRFL